jgi:hypothetical protein
MGYSLWDIRSKGCCNLRAFNPNNQHARFDKRSAHVPCETDHGRSRSFRFDRRVVLRNSLSTLIPVLSGNLPLGLFHVCPSSGRNQMVRAAASAAIPGVSIVRQTPGRATCCQVRLIALEKRWCKIAPVLPNSQWRILRGVRCVSCFYLRHCSLPRSWLRKYRRRVASRTSSVLIHQSSFLTTSGSSMVRARRRRKTKRS